jgi:nitroreductase
MPDGASQHSGPDVPGAPSEGGPRLTPLEGYTERPAAEMQRQAAEFADELQRRRSIRDFSSRPPPPGVIEDCIRAAAAAPSGANLQPWQFVVVRDPETKRRIREGAEEEERAFYGGRAPQDWRDALAPFGVDARKPFLETAPVLIVVFAQAWGVGGERARIKHYYVQESVGIAVGILIAAVHRAGLASLTHTPSPMRFLNAILKRPSNERPFLILVVGYPAETATVPDVARKPLADIVTFV